MLSHADLEALSCSLPEGVLSLRFAGLFDRELALIDDMLSRPLPDILRKRLEIEREAARRTEAEYTVSYDRMLTLLQARSPPVHGGGAGRADRRRPRRVAAAGGPDLLPRGLLRGAAHQRPAGHLSPREGHDAGG